MILVTCPLCKKRYQADESAIGTRVKCVACGANFPALPPSTSGEHIPLGSDKETIKYKCPKCSEPLENPGTLGGRKDKCPACGFVHAVPLSKGQKKEMDRLKEQERQNAQLARESEQAQEDALRRQSQKKADALWRQREEEEAKRLREAVAKPSERAGMTGTSKFTVGSEAGTYNDGPDLKKRCPYCSEEILAAAKKCKHCGEFLTDRTQVDPPQGAGGVGIARGPKPSMPTVINLGLGLFIVSFIMGILGGVLDGAPTENASTVMGAGCVSLLVCLAAILGVVMACLGRAWGAILLIFAQVVSLIVALAVPSVFKHPSVLVTLPVSIASFICFILPSSWRYYDASAAYRIGAPRVRSEGR